MASIQAGTYTIQEVLDAAGFDFATEAAAEYLKGEPDYRRVKVGGIGFDHLDERLTIPVTADSVVVTLDDVPHTTLDVALTDDQKTERAYSFETAADASDPDLPTQ